MSKNYDMIATVDIDIESPLVDDTSFDYMLLIGPPPANGSTPAAVSIYYSLSEVEDAGFVVSGDDADPIGAAATVAFSQSPKPDAIYIAVQQMDDDGELEAPTTTIKRALPTNGWYVICPAGIDSSEYANIAAYVETQEKMFVYTEMGFFGAAADGGNEATVGSVYYRTAGIYGRESTDQADEDVPEANKYMNVAWVIKWLDYESGSETAAFKSLAAVYPCELSTSEAKALENANLSWYMTVGSRNVTMHGTTMAGEWCDVIRFRDWLKNDMQVRVVTVFLSRPKVPYTDKGIALIQNAMEASLKAGQDVGGIAESEYDEDDNEIPGYTTSVPLSANITASQKVTRKLVDCKFTARLAGAIHFAEVTGSLTYEL